MRIRLTRSTVVDGRVVEAGQLVETGRATGRELVRMGKAVEEPEQLVPVPGIETAEAGPIEMATKRPGGKRR